jgi:hypothetical protein
MDRGSSKDRKHEAPTPGQHNHRVSKRPRGESHGILLQQASDEYYDAEADEDDVRTEVTTGDGKTHKNTSPAKSTVLILKQRLAHDAGLKPQQTPATSWPAAARQAARPRQGKRCGRVS